MRSFSELQKLIFKKEATSKPFDVKISFICMRIKLHFHVNGFHFASFQIEA